MAIVTRYFSTAAAGAGDGTTWANRAELLPSGSWSTVITGFSFAGSDALNVLVGPGTHTCSQTLVSGLFANPPTLPNSLFIRACDSSGTVVAPADPDWVSAQPAWSDTTMPVIATTTNVATSSLAQARWFFMKLTASGRPGSIVSAGFYNWCIFINSHASTSAGGVAGGQFTNCVVSCTGSSYGVIASMTAMWGHNNRIEGVTGSSGDRVGLRQSAGQMDIVGLTVVGCGGNAIEYTGSSAAQWIRASRVVLANNGGTGFKTNSTASQTQEYMLDRAMVTGNTGYGVDAQSAANVIITSSRFRDNGSGNFNGLGNYPSDRNIITTDDTDADDYVNVATGDYRIKTASALWGLGYGAGDEPAAASGAGAWAHRMIGGGF